MSIPDFSPMLLVATLVGATVTGAVTPASAKSPAITDVAYMNLSRCVGLSEGLGRDSAALKRMMDSESSSRLFFVYDRAADMRSEAVREAKRAGEDARRHLTAEAEGPCAHFVEPAQLAGG